ncbi:MAG: hypothetical protein ACFFGP_13695 [Promethearchaeota archaeon]
MEDQTAEGFALHQIGTRALCLEDVGTARTSLKKALQLREALGDRIGADITRHNLEILLGPPAPPWAERLFQYGGPVIVIFILWLLSRQTQVEIWLKDGCDREYIPGDQTHLFVEADTKCYARIRLDGEKITGKDILLTPGKPWSTDWPFKDIPPGEHRLTADFWPEPNYLPSLAASAPLTGTVTRQHFPEAECPFSVQWVVRTLAVDDDENVYVGGDFTSIGGVQANYIAMWDGRNTKWSALGGGPGGPVWSLALDEENANVYAGGDFDRTGDVANIARWKWNGSSWSPLGSGVCEPDSGMKCWVRGLAVDSSGDLYAGGWFHGITGVSERLNHVARWDGRNRKWSPLPGGLDGWVYALAVVDESGKVYADEEFVDEEGGCASRIVEWDGSAQQWSELASGLNGWVYALAVDGEGKIYAGGAFTEAGGVEVNHVAMWDDSAQQWSELASGLNDWVYALAVDGKGKLYAGGAFTAAGDVQVGHVAMWDGSKWSALGGR